MIVEGQGIGFWTRVRLPSSPCKKCRFCGTFYFCVAFHVATETGVRQEMDVMHLLADSLIRSREMVGLTQKQLSYKVGIYQADISKIERGIANPSVSTLKRLADGLDVELRIEFVQKK